MAPRPPRIDKLIEAMSPVLRRAFEESIQNLRGAAQIDLIARMLEAGDIDGALRAVGLDPVAFRPYDRAIASAFEASGAAAASALPVVRLSDGFRVQFNFNIRNVQAERWLSTHSSSMITEIVNDQRVMVRGFLQQGMAAGNNPRTVALDLVGRVGASGAREGGTIGLTSTQQQWVSRYAAELASNNPAAALSRALRDKRFDRAVIKAVNSGEPIPAGLQTKMVTAYKNRALRYRAETIARTEAMTSLHAAQNLAMEQAVATGAVQRENISFIWRTAADNRVRDSHVTMDGQEVAMGELFVTGDGNFLEYPGDPNGLPEETIQCFPANTLVRAENVKRAYRRWYEGNLVEIITASGRRLSGTPNHPVLTPHGWVGLGLIKERDNIVCNATSDAERASTFSGPDVKNVPACIEQVFDALANSGDGMRTCGNPMNFHGDGAYRNVDVIFVDGELVDGIDPFRTQTRKQFKFTGANKSALGFSAPNKLGMRSFHTKDSGVSLGDLGSALSLSHSRPLDSLGFGGVTNANAAVFQDSSDLTSRDQELFGAEVFRHTSDVSLLHSSSNLIGECSPDLGALFDPTNGLGVRRYSSFLDKSEDRVLRDSDNGADLAASLAGDVEIDSVVSVRRFDFCGHVYNLETGSGYYIANGVFVHNCRCWREPNIDFLAGLE